MVTNRLVASVVFAACVTLAVVAGPAIATSASPASPSPTSIALIVSADAGASWLASQFTSGGYIASATTPGAPDLTSTVNAVLALASTGIDPGGAQAALQYLETQVDTYVTDTGSDGPGELSLLILDAHALGVDPHNFGGTDLVARLLATEQTSGPDAGLFGAQDPTYDGAFRQGLALAALAAVGDTSASQVGMAESWLEAQQCPDGGWTSYVATNNPCNGDPANFEGPDTNSTALAIDGLEAQGALSTTSAASALSFIAGAQDSDGGWGYEPNASTAAGSTDPDSTALVLQAIEALGQSPSAAQFQQGSANPVSALLSFQVTSGLGIGAFSYPGTPGPNLLSTYQAVPAAAGVTFPFAATSTAANVAPTSATTGDTVTYGATVTATGATPAGSVTFSTGITVLCTTALVSGVGSCTAATAPVGKGDVIDATFVGASDFGLSTGTTSLTVSPLPVTAAAAGGSSSSGGGGTSVVAGATTVHTGEPFAGATPYALAIGGTGMVLVGLGARRRRRTIAARAGA